MFSTFFNTFPSESSNIKDRLSWGTSARHDMRRTCPLHKNIPPLIKLLEYQVGDWKFMLLLEIGKYFSGTYQQFFNVGRCFSCFPIIAKSWTNQYNARCQTNIFFMLKFRTLYIPINFIPNFSSLAVLHSRVRSASVGQASFPLKMLNRQTHPCMLCQLLQDTQDEKLISILTSTHAAHAFHQDDHDDVHKWKKQAAQAKCVKSVAGIKSATYVKSATYIKSATYVELVYFSRYSGPIRSFKASLSV